MSSGESAPAGPTPIRLVAHDPRWADAFVHEGARIVAALGDVLVRIHHVGSTSIADIVAKPVIDILLEVSSLDALDMRATRLGALGYEAKGEFGIAGRRYFRKDDAHGSRTHQVHAFAAGFADVQRHLDFRDYLRAHPDVARAYGVLKQELARRAGSDVASYTDAKTPFVREVERRAAEWRARTPHGDG